MRTLDVLWGELVYAREQVLEIRRIRITPDALIGSPTTVPFTRERLRTMYLRAYPGGVVDAELGQTDRWRELLIHPVDWWDMLVEPEISALDMTGDIVRVWGVPVVR